MPNGTPAHFDLMEWVIDLGEYEYQSLSHDALTQSVFLHEYIHYVQTLAATIGRLSLISQLRIGIQAGLERVHGTPLPDPLLPAIHGINLTQILTDAFRADFEGSTPASQYQDLMCDLGFFLGEDIRQFNGHYNENDPFISMPRRRGGQDIQIRYLICEHERGNFRVALTDRVIIENMARQIERLFLVRNGVSADVNNLDNERYNPGELNYVSIHDLVSALIPSGEDSFKWTVGVCQNALSYRNPGSAIYYMVQWLGEYRGNEFQDFLDRFYVTDYHTEEYNIPNLQGEINFVLGLLSLVPAQERYDIQKFTEKIARVFNNVQDNKLFFYSADLTWDDVKAWLSSYGCPPIISNGRTYNEIEGVECSQPCFDYLQLIHSRLA